MPEKARKGNNAAPLVGAFLFLASFALYLLTVAPSVTFWDSGELIAASWQLGISHQPGYPLYALAGKFFSLLPFGSIAYRCNLLSAFFSALTVAMLYYALLEATDRDKPFLPAAVALCLAPVRVFWAVAVVAEVYALNSFFIVLLVFLYIRAARGRLGGGRYIILSGFIYGLAVVNHGSAVLYLPALVLTWALVPFESGRERLKTVITASTLFLLGLSVLLYLPIRSAAGPWVNIGHPDNAGQLWWTLRWGEYLREVPALPAKVLAVSGRLIHSGPVLMIILALASFFAWRLWKISWRLYLPLMLFAAVYLAGISFLVTGGEADERFGLSAKFFIPALVMGLLFLGAVAADVFRRRGARTALAACFLVASTLLAARNWRVSDYSRNFIAHDYAANSLKSAAEGGALFTWGDNGAFPLWYLHEVERYRDDAAIIHAPLLTYGWYLKDTERRLKTEIDFMEPYFLGENVFRIFTAVSPERRVAYDFSSTRFLNLQPERLTARGLVYYEGPAPERDLWQLYVFRGVDDPKVFKGGMEKNIIQIYNYLGRQLH